MVLMFLLSFGLLIVDRLTKHAVMAWMTVNESIPIIKDFLHLTYVQNRGASFGMLQGQRLFLVLVTLAAIVTIILYSRQAKGNKWMQAALGLMLGGAVGNLIDRLYYKYVIDFVDFTVIDFPVFNAADSGIVIGVGLFALLLLLEWKRERHET